MLIWLTLSLKKSKKRRKRREEITCKRGRGISDNAHSFAFLSVLSSDCSITCLYINKSTEGRLVGPQFFFKIAHLLSLSLEGRFVKSMMVFTLGEAQKITAHAQTDLSVTSRQRWVVLSVCGSVTWANFVAPLGKR